ncbi:flagellar filament capping protein FliD [Pantoea sp. KPR_PJ]|uniref:flagellar filament capping protein FliD n=1 Tax=Pantoea sp. KPR_PJ TaxID=2738375 RepID=UPI003527790E
MAAVSSSFSVIGVGTGGIDTASMLAQLQSAEQTRLTPYQQLQSSYKNKISSWGNISSLMTKLQTSVKKLNGEAFNTLTVSTNTSFTATATDKASADAHSVTVEQLATAHKLRTQGFKSADAQLGTQTSKEATRTLTIQQEDGKSMTITLKDDQTSLNQIAKAINSQSGSVSASVQRNGDGEYQLMLSSKKTGNGGKMSVSVDGDSDLAAVLNTAHGGKSANNADSQTDAMSQVTAAQDAKVTVDGTEYTRSSNNISDIINGVTLSLKSVTKDKEPEQLTLTVDTSAIKTTLQDFVKQYNALLTQTSADSKYVKADTSSQGQNTVATQSSASGALMGDATLRGMVSELRSRVNGWYGDANSDNASFGALADLGITIDAQSGQMTLNESKLDKAIASDADAIGKMFKGSGNTEGLATALGSVITKYVGDTESKTNGVIKTATDNLNSQLKNIGTQITKTQALIDSQVNRYRVQFQNLDSVMSKLNSMSSSVNALMASIS